MILFCQRLDFVFCIHTHTQTHSDLHLFCNRMFDFSPARLMKAAVVPEPAGSEPLEFLHPPNHSEPFNCLDSEWMMKNIGGADVTLQQQTPQLHHPDKNGHNLLSAEWQGSATSGQDIRTRPLPPPHPTRPFNIWLPRLQ